MTIPRVLKLPWSAMQAAIPASYPNVTQLRVEKGKALKRENGKVKGESDEPFINLLIKFYAPLGKMPCYWSVFLTEVSRVKC
jgi:hypothetical protein